MVKRFLLPILLIAALLTSCALPVTAPVEMPRSAAEATAAIQTAATMPDALSTPIGAEGLTVWFVDVGQGDCVVITDGEVSLLVDAGGNADGEAVAAFLRGQGIEHVAYAVGTHPHEDHIGGMDRVLDAVSVGVLLVPDAQSDTKTYLDVLAAAERNGTTVERVQPETVYRLGSYTMTILGPVRQYENMNDNSVVARVDYGGTSFLLTGDIEEAAEKDILSMGYDVECTVLKAPHHGSETSSSYVFLRAIYPEIVAIQCGEGNSYGHPHDGPLSRYRDVGATVYRNDLLGTIRMTSDGAAVTVDAQGEQSAVTRAPREADGLAQGGEIILQQYVGNKNSKKFHLPDCSSLPAEQNRVSLDSRAEAIGAGYEPCGVCKP